MDAQEPTTPTLDIPRWRKRNKPTLNCTSCVVRKTKCDRVRPSCMTCLRRKTSCQYTITEDMMLRTRKRRRHVSAPFERNTTVTVESRPESQSESSEMLTKLVTHVNAESPSMSSVARSQTSSGLREKSLFHRFDINSCHPFHNYWTSTGGLAEVISVLPRKEDAEILIRTFFMNVDATYPIIPEQMFMSQWEEFWALSPEEMANCDPAMVALQLAVYACGAQYNEKMLPGERASLAEFYLSACHQALCISSYLSQCSMLTIQVMILVCHFLISDGRISDAWTFSGITQRQAYGLQLNRDPEAVQPDASFAEKQQRCRLWLATMFQDTSLSMFLEMPPATIHHDVHLDSLQLLPPTEQSWNILDSPGRNVDFANHMNSATDIAYLKAIWQYTTFTQTHLCIPRSLKQPLVSDQQHKQRLIAEYREMYQSFDAPFNSTDPSRFETPDQRLLRQLISLTSNVFFTLIILYRAQNEASDVQLDVFGALEAAHEGMLAFFKLARLWPVQVNTWSAAHTRAYAQAKVIGSILSAQETSVGLPHRDPRLMLAKSDFDRYLDVLERACGSAEFAHLQLQRIAELEAVRGAINVA